MKAPLIEFPADDPDRARRFWHGVLGVTLAARPAAAGSGWETDTDGLRLGVHERGAGPGDTASLPYFTVADLATTLERVRELGGSIVHPGDRWAVCRDSEGSPFALAAAARAKRQRGLSVPRVSNLEQVQELYSAFGRGEIEPVLAALAPDVEWVEGDIEGLPYGGVHRGPEAVGRDVFAQIPGAYESFELVPQEWVDGGDTIVMLGRVTVRLEGRESSQSVAQVWKFQDGKITRFESFQDTLATARVLGAVD